MNYKYCVLCLPLLLSGCVVSVNESGYGPYTRMETLDRQQVELAAGPGDSLEFRSLPGEITVTGSDGDVIIAKVEMMCRERSEHCRDYHRELSLESTNRDGRIRLGFNKRIFGHPGEGTLKTLISVPRLAAVELKMGAGQINVTDVVTDSLVVDLATGDINISMPEASVSTVNVDTGVGDAYIRSSDSFGPAPRSFLVGAQQEKRFSDTGTEIDADVQFGNIEVYLTD